MANRVENGQLIKVLHEKRDEVINTRRYKIHEDHLKERSDLERKSSDEQRSVQTDGTDGD